MCLVSNFSVNCDISKVKSVNTEYWGTACIFTTGIIM